MVVDEIACDDGEWEREAEGYAEDGDEAERGEWRGGRGEIGWLDAGVVEEVRAGGDSEEVCGWDKVGGGSSYKQQAVC